MLNRPAIVDLKSFIKSCEMFYTDMAEGVVNISAWPWVSNHLPLR